MELEDPDRRNDAASLIAGISTWRNGYRLVCRACLATTFTLLACEKWSIGRIIITCTWLTTTSEVLACSYIQKKCISFCPKYWFSCQHQNISTRVERVKLLYVSFGGIHEVFFLLGYGVASLGHPFPTLRDKVVIHKRWEVITLLRDFISHNNVNHDTITISICVATLN